jgi:GPI mannosyltransferase 4
MGLMTAALAITMDTAFYKPDMSFSTLMLEPVITPFNNLMYNAQSSNLAEHGLHPYYQHVVANLPQLLGPAFPLLFLSYRKTWYLTSAVGGIVLLSLFPHQEARFLLPAVPLILSAVRPPKRLRTLWMTSWIVFNMILGVLMGVYHQGGVVPASIYLGTMSENVTDVFWWKTYSPPVWLLDGKSSEVTTHNLMGMPSAQMIDQVLSVSHCEGPKSAQQGMVLLVAPRSATFLDQYLGKGTGQELELDEIWSYKSHLNLDDMDFGDDGIWPTLQRVIGRRGLVVRRVRRYCNSK